MKAGGDLFVGLDLGTSSLKGVAVTAGGEMVARGHAAYRTTREAAGQAEQDTAAWQRAVARVVRQLQAAAPPGRWRAVGLSAMIPTLVTVDGAGRPTGPAVTWEDSRAEHQGEAFRELTGATHYERTGQWVDGRYLLPMWMRLRQAEPGRVAQATRLLSAKDHLFAWLTGEVATDPSTAAGFGCYDLAGGVWMSAAAGAAGVTAGDGPEETAGAPGEPGLPAVLPATTLRPLRAAAARRLGLPPDLPVCLGAADSVLGALALGAAHAGDVAYITGTSSVIIGVSADLLVDGGHRYLVTPLAGTPGWGLEMDLLSTGSAVRWLSQLLCLGRDGEARLMALAAKAGTIDDAAAPTAGDLRFLPFLGGGEQGALWDPALRGTVLGLGLGHGPADLARALVDGIVLESRRCLEVLEQNGLPPAPIRIAGAGASSPFFRRRLADASGRAVMYVADREQPLSALGAALIAARALGAAPAADRLLAGAVERTSPDPGSRDEWQRRWVEHQTVVEQLQDLYRRV